ncbi:YhcB family protein [Eionea flava]
MFSLTTLLIAAATAFIAGCLLSLLLNRSLSPSEKKSRALETRLQETEEKLTNYQQEVTDHFAQTAQLVNNLTQNYKDVHEHLAGSALKLANVDISRQLLSTGVNDNDKPLNDNEETFQPPKDWAPGEGALSESYGLEKERDALVKETTPESPLSQSNTSQ